MRHAWQRTHRPAQPAARGTALWVLLLAGLALNSCASNDKAKPNYAEMKWAQRVNQQMKDPGSISTPFQKQVFNASRDVKTQDFKAGSFRNTKAFSGGDDKFKAGSFAQAGKSSGLAGESFPGADDKSNLGSESFKTGQSRFNGQANRNAGKTSPLADDVFKAGQDREGAKASANAKRPLIQDPEAPSYSEAEVRSFLNKLWRGGLRPK